MALAKQFYSSFKSYNGWDYYLEIWVEGYSGSASEILIGAGGPVITYGTDEQDRFSPILSSKLELPFMVTNTTQDAFIKNIRENFNEQDVYIHLYRASSSDYSSVAPLWSGFVLMDLSASPDLYYPYPVTLTAVDGLSLLKEIDFSKSGTAGSYTDADMYSSNGRFTYWLKEILLKSGASTTTQGSTQDYKFTTAINWFNSVMPTITQSTDPFYQTKCNTKMFFSKDADENFTVVNCYDVLKNLLKHWGARIIYWKHIFYIVQIQEYNTAESGTYANPDNIDTRTYTKTGAFDSSSDNLGDSYWTRYNLLIDDVTGGIQKLAGSQFNYLPQLKRTQAKFIDYGNKNYFGGLPYDLTTGQTDVIYQDTISDVSVDGSMILIIPLDVTMVTQYLGVLQMALTFRMYITDGATTYYLRYDPSNTPKYYWENATTANLNSKKTVWKSNLDNIVGTQTKVGFHEQIEFKDVSGSALTLTGDWDIYTDIDNWGSNNGSFKLVYAQNGLFNTQVLYAPSASTIYWTNTLNPNYQTPLNPSVIGQTNQPTAYNPNFSLNPTTSNSIVSYTSQLNINPFEGKLLIVNASASGALYGSFVSVSPNPTTKDSEIVDFGDLIWGDTLLASSEGSLKVWNGSSFVKSNVIGTWGLGSTSGSNSFTEMLLSEYLYGQTKVIESPSMRLVIGETNKNQNDGSGSRPNYINPIGRLKGYSATGTTPYYIFKSGSFHLLKDEVDYQGYQIIRDTQSLTKTDNIIIGPDILQDKTNKIGQKTPQTNTLVNKITQNSYITTVSAIKSAYGNDIAVNGIFATDTGWTKGTGWSISSNKAIFSPTGSTSDIKQDTLTNALTYKIIVTLTLSAGGLSVKAGSSGNSTVLSASGTYEVFSTCSGSTDVIFEASAAFEGYIEKVVVQQQVPVTSININAIGTAVFKTNDVLNVADVDGDEVNEFTVSADQGASDTSISVTSKLITEDILEGSIILVNQNDLAAQYQNKTKGTVGGFDITATSIDSGSVAISSYIDDDTFATASATSLATSESIKAYVDGQAGLSENLQTVTDNGNTTTNSIMIGSTSSPDQMLHISGLFPRIKLQDTDATNTADNSLIEQNNGVLRFRNDPNFLSNNSAIQFDIRGSEKMRLTSGGNLGIGTTSPYQKLGVNGNIQIGNQGSAVGFVIFNGTNVGLWNYENGYIRFGTNSAERMRLTSGGNVLINTTTDVSGVKLQVNGNTRFGDSTTGISFGISSTDVYQISGVDTGFSGWNSLHFKSDGNDGLFIQKDTNNVGINQVNPTEKLHVVGDILATGDSHADAFKPAVSGNPIKFKNFDSSTEFARITDAGNLLLGTTTTYYAGTLLGVGDTSDSQNGLQITTSTTGNGYILFGDGTSADAYRGEIRYAHSTDTLMIKAGGTNILNLTGTTATFSGQVTIPATPVASTDAASKGYVDAQVSATDSLQEVTTVGNTTTNSIMIGSSSSPDGKLHIQNTIVNGGGAQNILILDGIENGGDMLAGDGPRLLFKIPYNSLDSKVGASIDAIKSINADSYSNTDLVFNISENNETLNEAMRIKSNSNVLIGTTTDSGAGDGNKRLQVVSPNSKISATFGKANGATGDYTGIGLVASGNEVKAGLFFEDTASFNRGSLHFANRIALDNDVDMTLADSKMSITSNGNVLIGTTTDNGDKLQIGVANSAPSFATDPNVATTIASTTNGDEVALQLYVNDGTNNIRSKYFVDDTELLAGFDVTYSTGLNGFAFKMIGSEKMRLSSGGNLLIGTTTDSGYKLDVVGGVRQTANNPILVINNQGSSQTGTLYFRDAFGGATIGARIQTAGNALGLRTGTSGDDDLVITSSGNVLIGTTTDDGSNKLQVDGNIKIGDNNNFIAGTGSDLQLQHDGSNSYINNNTGDLYIKNLADDGDILFQSDDGSGGTETYFYLDGGQKFIIVKDSIQFCVGTGQDSRWYHDGSNTSFKNYKGNFSIEALSSSGDMILTQFGDDRDIIFKCDDGSGGTTDYIRLDGSQTTVNVYKTLLIGTTTNTGAYKIDVAGKQRVQDTLELDDVLMLNAISTPSDPAAGKSVIYMDSSDGGIKCKINVGGTVVERTIASFE